MNFNREKFLKGFEKNPLTSIDCSVSKASNEIMLHRISEGKDIDFPFGTVKKA